ncbi:hypothetical protein SEA_COMRADE_257 [Streptomyces phage Comrade]|uniref:Uncharacterized protein n=3 Tax=Gilsonvirus comrade TaxID=2846395 RepID=A0A345MEF9_9CAUD|nr:hypothetical protein HWB84_gp021 [Streptomyces phage Comrade]AXH68940.1 hypothetical protein SEA_SPARKLEGODDESS_261 [Streptomyces phage SparkleGoddess]QQO39914.1 hypothetical protein SEA_BELFORT_262 [Streptomyces phage Belfort]QZE11826.1 hypothetical protein SEA_KARP_261 [Streptomyces phage Karp]UTN92483.1 hypothetical protein SEA_STIGMA_259 [Streptomyces phage Stigma]AXQ63488.1 hypothetical protein SEA_COMRADE_257 [Streptomyces phage Comrade]
MRTVTVNGKSGIIAARGMGPNEGSVFVLFDGDDSAESGAGWVSVESVTVTGVVAGTF